MNNNNKTNGGEPHICGTIQIHNGGPEGVRLCPKCLTPVDIISSPDTQEKECPFKNHKAHIESLCEHPCPEVSCLNCKYCSKPVNVPLGKEESSKCCYCRELGFSSQPEEWQKTFLNTGTLQGYGDLSGMITVVSSLISKARQTERSRLISIAEKLKGDNPVVPSKDVEMWTPTQRDEYHFSYGKITSLNQFIAQAGKGE